MLRHINHSLLLLIFVFGAVNLAWASCGSAGCPIDTFTVDPSEKGYVRVDYTYEYINQDQPMIGRNNAAVGELRGHHDEVFTVNQIQKISLDAGLTDRLNIQAILPFIHREHQHIHHHHGSDIINTWNFNGMGDLTLLGRFALIQGSENKSRWSVIAGGILPTGRDQALDGDGNEAEAGILPGKGTYSLIMGGSVSKNFKATTLNGMGARLPVFFSSTYQWNNQGRDAYRIGNTWLANLGMVYPILPKIGIMTQINTQISRKDHKGNTSEEVEKTGGSYVYFSPGIELSLAENFWANVLVQIPVYQRVNRIQLTSESNFLMGISYRFKAI